MVQTKETHAQLCKQELLILWSDYFKPENAPADLHETFWKAAKLCSYNKQHVDLAKSQELMDVVAKISDMFQKAEAAKKENLIASMQEELAAGKLPPVVQGATSLLNKIAERSFQVPPKGETERRLLDLIFVQL